MKIKTLFVVLALTMAFCATLRAQNLSIHTCSYIPGYMQGSQPQMGPPYPPLTSGEFQLLSYFNKAYSQRIPPLPLMTLYGEANARAGAFGIAINRQWMSSMGNAMGVAILAHELGHVCQGYQLLPIDPIYIQYGMEGQADYFAGRLLAASGFPAQVFESQVLPFIAQNQASKTHPPGSIRVMLTKAGFYATP